MGRQLVHGHGPSIGSTQNAQTGQSAARHATDKCNGQFGHGQDTEYGQVSEVTRCARVKHEANMKSNSLPDRDLGDVLGRLTGDPGAEAAAESERSLWGPRMVSTRKL